MLTVRKGPALSQVWLAPGPTPRLPFTACHLQGLGVSRLAPCFMDEPERRRDAPRIQTQRAGPLSTSGPDPLQAACLLCPRPGPLSWAWARSHACSEFMETYSALAWDPHFPFHSPTMGAGGWTEF